MAVQDYDPQKRHDRYERTKQLKGRGKGSKATSANPSHPAKSVHPIREQTQASHDRVIRVRGKIKKLEGALSEAQAELSTRRQKSRAAKKASSDGKSTAAEKQASQEYRDKHKTELASKSKKSSSSSKSGGGSKSSSSSVADMSTKALEARVIKIKGAIRDARRLLSSASIEHGQLMHSAIVSDPDVNERFARFNSAERGPSR